MKRLLLIILLMGLFSCKKEETNPSTPILTTNSYFKKAKEYQKKQVSDSAFYYFNLAKNAFLKDKDSWGVARSLTNMAIIQTEKGDYYGSIETSLRANSFLKNEKETDSIVRIVLSANYNNLAISSSNLKNFDSSVSYYNKALKYVNIEEHKFTYYNNIGDALISQKKFTQAKDYLELALATKDSANYAMALNNLAKAKFLENKKYDPLPDLFKALQIRRKQQNDSWGENSSYATLADYFYNKDQSTSLMYAKMMLEKAVQNKSADDQLEALQKIIILDKTDYLKNFLKFQSINDSVQTARNKDKDQFAVFRYDIDVKTAENEMLKAVTAENKNRTLILLIALILAIITIIWYRRRQKRLKQENELKIKNNQLKLSKKVHDVVANGLYHMMIDVQNNPEIDKTRILNDIEKMYEESRDISHENIVEKDFSLRFINMVTSYSSDEQKVLPVGYKENIWENISSNTQLELYYILREILVNMKKHSQAKLASVKFENDGDTLKIRYIDNGIGINNFDQQKGTGIHNTENRIDTIGGHITFEKNPTGGLTIQITIPIH